MNQLVTQKPNQSRGLTAVMAERFQMEPSRFVEAIKATVIKGNVSDGQLAAFLMVAHEYSLNPLTKEIYAFPSNGGIQPIVSIDGWMKMINSHPEFDGMEFQDHVGDDGKVQAITCRIYRKDRSRPTEATEYMAECVRSTEPWKKWPLRMLRHKAAIQCARYAFSFAGVMDEDEFDRMKDVTPQKSGAERLAAAQAQTQEPKKQEGFSLQHVEETTAKAVKQEPEASPEEENPALDLEPSEPSDMSEESENPALIEAGQSVSVLDEFKSKLRLLGDVESIDELKAEYADRLNQMNAEDKKMAREAIAACKQNVRSAGQ